MALVPAICTQCGAQIEIDTTHEAGICKHCGTAFITEKAINHYNMTNNNNISANVVNIYGYNSTDFEIRAGVLERYNGAMTEVVIPNTVSIIGRRAFYECSGLTQVTVPSSVTEIGESAFRGCTNLKEIIIPDSVTLIGDYAFDNCLELTKIVLTKNITVINYSMFQNCKKLNNVNLPTGIIKIEKYAFSQCTSLTNIVIPNTVTTICDNAFSYCKELKSIKIPDSVVNIEKPFGKTIYGEYPDQFIEYIEASEEWKRRNFKVASCLSDYAPTHKPSNISGCYIATCIYGSYDCPQVWTLRRFRDYTLDETWYGRIFIKCYYAISPTLVKWFGNRKWFRTFWKNRLDAMVSKLNNIGIDNTEYSDKY